LKHISLRSNTLRKSKPRSLPLPFHFNSKQDGCELWHTYAEEFQYGQTLSSNFFFFLRLEKWLHGLFPRFAWAAHERGAATQHGKSETKTHRNRQSFGHNARPTLLGLRALRFIDRLTTSAALSHGWCGASSGEAGITNGRVSDPRSE